MSFIHISIFSSEQKLCVMFHRKLIFTVSSYAVKFLVFIYLLHLSVLFIDHIFHIFATEQCNFHTFRKITLNRFLTLVFYLSMIEWVKYKRFPFLGKHLLDFTEMKNMVYVAPANKTYNASSAAECAAWCDKEEAFACQSFSYCENDPDGRQCLLYYWHPFLDHYQIILDKFCNLYPRELKRIIHLCMLSYFTVLCSQTEPLKWQLYMLIMWITLKW